MDEFFKIERKKHFDFYLPFYQEKNWLVEKDNINGNIKIDWDVELEIFAGVFKKVDEKVRIGEHNDCLIEIIQDIRTKNWGWIFGEKDWVLYGSWKELDEIYPSSLYLIKTEELKKYIFDLDGRRQLAISKKGWGNTWNIILEWNDLILRNVAQKLI